MRGTSAFLGDEFTLAVPSKNLFLEDKTLNPNTEKSRAIRLRRDPSRRRSDAMVKPVFILQCRLRRPATRSQLKCIPHCNLTSSRALTFSTFLFPFLGQMSAGAGCSPRKRSKIIFHGSDPDESSQVIVIRYHSPMIFTFSAVSRNCSRCNRRLLNYS